MPVGESISAAAVFDAVVKKLAANMILKYGANLVGSITSLEADFGEHLKQSFDRCTKVRTILNRDESVDLLSLYTNLKFSKENTAPIDDYDLIDRIYDKKRFVVTGSGGGGKTMFMKYLWLSIFETRQDRVPLFIEMRRFNDITSHEFSAFLFHSIKSISSKIKQDDFERSLREGAFVLLLDGFDEIADDRRSFVENEVLKLTKLYPNLSIVLSSRPDERFEG